jgi:hypothetical protein
MKTKYKLIKFNNRYQVYERKFKFLIIPIWQIARTIEEYPKEAIFNTIEEVEIFLNKLRDLKKFANKIDDTQYLRTIYI